MNLSFLPPILFRMLLENPYQLYHLCLPQMTWCPNQTEPVRLL